MRSAFETVYLAPHGETESNRERRRQGQLDSPLTEHGRMQAVAVATALRGRAIGGVFCSPLGRAAETAKIIGQRLDLPPIELTDLAEIHHGDMAGLSEAQIDERFSRGVRRTSPRQVRLDLPQRRELRRCGSARFSSP